MSTLLEPQALVKEIGMPKAVVDVDPRRAAYAATYVLALAKDTGSGFGYATREQQEKARELGYAHFAHGLRIISL